MNDPRTRKLTAQGTIVSGGPSWDSWLDSSLAAGVSGTWPTANRAYLFPFRTERPAIVKQLFWENGAAVSGNVDCGIYTLDGTRIVSTGATAQSGTSTSQVVDITDTLLGPGLYWCALVMDNTTGTVMRSVIAERNVQNYGYLFASASYPLPATITLATFSGVNFLPHGYGLSLQDVF